MSMQKKVDSNFDEVKGDIKVGLRELKERLYETQRNLMGQMENMRTEMGAMRHLMKQ